MPSVETVGTLSHFPHFSPWLQFRDETLFVLFSKSFLRQKPSVINVDPSPRLCNATRAASIQIRYLVITYSSCFLLLYMCFSEQLEAAAP